LDFEFGERYPFIQADIQADRMTRGNLRRVELAQLILAGLEIDRSASARGEGANQAIESFPLSRRFGLRSRPSRKPCWLSRRRA
jgi:hypothetical protein